MGSTLAVAANLSEPDLLTEPELIDFGVPEAPIASQGMLRLFEAPTLMTFLSGCQGEATQGNEDQLLIGLILGLAGLAYGMTLAVRQVRRRWEQANEVPLLIAEIQKYEAGYSEEARDFTSNAKSRSTVPWSEITGELSAQLQQAFRDDKRTAILAHGLTLAGTLDWMTMGCTPTPMESSI